jgi:hypothetical protein
LDSRKYAPSRPMVDIVWHTRLAFNDRYLHDVAAFAARIGKELTGPVVLQHCPFLYIEAMERYIRTYRHLSRNMGVEEKYHHEKRDDDEDYSDQAWNGNLEEQPLDPQFLPSPTMRFLSLMKF